MLHTGRRSVRAGTERLVARQETCSICTRPITDGSSVKLGPESGGANIGSYCSERCRDAAHVILEMSRLDVGTSPERQATRAQVADQLLARWRLGRGPDPAAVLRLVQGRLPRHG